MRTFDELSEKEKQKFIAMIVTKESNESDFRDVVDSVLWWFQLGTIVCIAIVFGFGMSGFSYLLTGREIFLSLTQELVTILTMFIPLGLIIILILLTFAIYQKQRNERAFFLIFGIDKIAEFLDIKKEDLKNIKLGWKKVK